MLLYELTGFCRTCFHYSAYFRQQLSGAICLHSNIVSHILYIHRTKQIIRYYAQGSDLLLHPAKSLPTPTSASLISIIQHDRFFFIPLTKTAIIPTYTAYTNYHTAQKYSTNRVDVCLNLHKIKLSYLNMETYA